MKPVRIGICGLGTVGSAVVQVLSRNAEQIAQRLGTTVDIEVIGARRDNPQCDTSAYTVTRDVLEVATWDVDVVVELIGGTDVAKTIVLESLRAGKHVVTANKALIAEHGNMLVAEAQKQGVMLNFEAAVAGGIPVLQSLKDSLAGNNISQVVGIINGTSNYILSAMQTEQLSFEKALKDAQLKGYAEEDPTFDVGGYDAAHKLCILASLSFGIPLMFDSVYCEGITNVTLEDIAYANDLGYTIKHIGIARKTRKHDVHSYELRVHPTLVSQDAQLAHIHGALNAVQIDADSVGSVLLTGAGAGGDATASAVIGDIINVARYASTNVHLRTPSLAFQHQQLDGEIQSIESIDCANFLRMDAEDKPGVMAKVSQIFADEAISIEAIVQKQRVHLGNNDHIVPIVLVTHTAEEYRIARAITQLEGLSSVRGTVQRIRKLSEC